VDEPQNERWEHHVELITANAHYNMPFVQQFYPPQTPIPAFAIQAILPRLNGLGGQGWELVHMQPVRVGSNGDVDVESGGTHVYLCSFKRRIRS
jgi:hypothetical protein